MADADTTLNQIFTGDPSKLLSAYKQVVAENIRLEQQTNRLGQTTKKAAEDGVKSHDALAGTIKMGVTSLQSMLTGWVSVSAAIGVATAALEDHKRRVADVRNTFVTSGIAERAVLANLPGEMSSAAKRAFLGDVERMAAAANFPDVAQLKLAAGEGLAAGMTVEQLRSALPAAARLAVRPEDAAGLTSGLGMLQRTTGVTDAATLLGFNKGVQGLSPITSEERTLRNLAPAIQAMVDFSETRTDTERQQVAREAGSLFATFGQFGGDVRGESSGTNLISFGAQLRKFFREGVTSGSGRSARTIKPEFDPRLPGARLEMIQADPRLQQAFLSQLAGEEKFKPTMEALIRGGTEQEAYFEQGIGRIRFDPKLTEAALAERTLTPSLTLAAREDAAKAIKQARELAQPGVAFREQGRLIRDEIMAATRGYSEQGFAAYATEPASFNLDAMVYGDDQYAMSAYIGQVEGRLSEIRRRRPFMGIPLTGGGTDRDLGQLSPQEQKDYAAASEALNLLKQIAADMKRSADTNQNMNDRDKAPKVGTNPAANAQRGVRNER